MLFRSGPSQLTGNIQGVRLSNPVETTSSIFIVSHWRNICIKSNRIFGLLDT